MYKLKTGPKKIKLDAAARKSTARRYGSLFVTAQGGREEGEE